MISVHPKRDVTLHPKNYRQGFKEAEPHDIESLAVMVSDSCWSPIIWSGGECKTSNFKRADWIALDFDNGEMPLKEAQKTFCDMIHIIGTTKSHGREKSGIICDRYRVILKLERAIEDLKDYKYTLEKYKNRYPIDKAACDGARFFYPCKAIIQKEGEGYFCDQWKAPEGYGQSNVKKHMMMRKMVVLPRWVTLHLESKIPVGERNNTLFRLGCFFGKSGYSLDESIEIITRSECTDLEPSEIIRACKNGYETGQKEI